MNVTVTIVQNAEELQQALEIRKTVFVEEQQVPEEIEVDEYENTSVHFLAWEGHRPIGTCRLRWINSHTAKAERVAVLKDKRNTGAGKQLMQALEDYAKKHGAQMIVLNAQTQALPFYQKLGYKEMGTPFYEEHIEHIRMQKHLT
ncbi:GNAT family N-acetyltransferase [Thermoflavimicrobium dichotomicum]|uniref:Predicted N-acyltransferase, GNAT family n=1 Tax=Thermoflavimicrobium dichotomicum TaxID=46223 RepID=A0A1I3ND31_9BACL|nr:GNAT family N-acetyltransferase [Thermoflavimicrobium dichotomicum]SFJ06706.1 Predicted N-acyltransferase, GNAT family [Thermoflavimicrobium dichotomicum]